eukprot:scaffold303908_cov28-Tisochrysis_lutea.AAC.6
MAAAPPPPTGIMSSAVSGAVMPDAGCVALALVSPISSQASSQTSALPPRMAANITDPLGNEHNATRSFCPASATSPVVAKSCSLSMEPSVARKRHTKSLPSLATLATRLSVLVPPLPSLRKWMSTACMDTSRRGRVHGSHPLWPPYVLPRPYFMSTFANSKRSRICTPPAPARPPYSRAPPF